MRFRCAFRCMFGGCLSRDSWPHGMVSSCTSSSRIRAGIRAQVRVSARVRVSASARVRVRASARVMVRVSARVRVRAVRIRPENGLVLIQAPGDRGPLEAELVAFLHQRSRLWKQPRR